MMNKPAPQPNSNNLPDPERPKDLKSRSGKSAKTYRLERDEALDQLTILQSQIAEKAAETEKLLKEEYKRGYQKALDDHPPRVDNSEIWFQRNQYNESEVKRLKAIIAEIMELIVRKTI